MTLYKFKTYYSFYDEFYDEPLSGEYRVGGLSPGQYYVAAFGIDEGIGYHNMPGTWDAWEDKFLLV